MASFAALSTFVHYHDHLWPIIEGLRLDGHDVEDLTTWRNADFAQYVHPKDIRLHRPDLWLVAGAVDAKHVAPAKCVYVEHGAGQTYDADLRGQEHQSYSTGTIPNAALFLCPNLFVQARRARSGVLSVAVGAPRLDQWPIGNHDGVQDNAVAFAFHWDCAVVPETRSAFDHFLPEARKIAIALRRRHLIPVCHGHPRIAKRVRWHLEKAGFEWWDISDVLTKAACLVADNTSLMYEFAHIDRPIVVLNAPWYRRHVHHGLRFWECLPGAEVDEPKDLPDAVLEALTIDPKRPERRRCAEQVFPLQGGATARATAMIEAALEHPVALRHGD